MEYTSSVDRVSSWSSYFFPVVIAIAIFVGFNAEAWHNEAQSTLCSGECINIAEELDDSIKVIRSLDN